MKIRTPHDMLLDSYPSWAHIAQKADPEEGGYAVLELQPDQQQHASALREEAIALGANRASILKTGNGEVFLKIPADQFHYLSTARFACDARIESRRRATGGVSHAPVRCADGAIDLLSAKACRLLFGQGSAGWTEIEAGYDANGRWDPCPRMRREVTNLDTPIQALVIHRMGDVLHGMGAREYVIEPSGNGFRVTLPEPEYRFYIAPELLPTRPDGPLASRLSAVPGHAQPRVVEYAPETRIRHLQKRIFGGGRHAWICDKAQGVYVRDQLRFNAHDIAITAGDPVPQVAALFTDLFGETAEKVESFFVLNNQLGRTLEVRVPIALFEREIAPKLQPYSAGELDVPNFVVLDHSPKWTR